MVRGRPSGLKAAFGTAARRPAAGPDPGDHCGPSAAAIKGQARRPAPGRAAPEPKKNPAIVNTETVIYRRCCDNPLNPRRQNIRKTY